MSIETEQQGAPGTHRERLLAGLAQSIREKGLAQTQIADIVRNARASRRTFYQSFDDKEACFVALAEQLVAGVMLEVERAVDRDAPWDEQLAQAIDKYLGLLAAEPALTVTFTRDLPALGARGVQLQRDGIERYAQLLVGLVNVPELERQGIGPVSMETAVMLVGGLRELIVRAVDHGTPLADVGAVAKGVFAATLAPGQR
jgi:AcrR family transcriptional regulator